MSKAKEFWYVLAMTSAGPKFITEVGRDTVRWDGKEPAKMYNKEDAQTLATGLMYNGNLAYAVCSPSELDTQPYDYDHYELELKRKEMDQDATEK